MDPTLPQFLKALAVLYCGLSLWHAIEAFYAEGVDWDLETRIEITIKELLFWWY